MCGSSKIYNKSCTEDESGNESIVVEGSYTLYVK